MGGHDGKISGMNTNSEANLKNELRVNLKARRDGASYDPDLAAALNVQLAELCLINGAKKIGCYLATPNEPDTELFIDWALENEIEVLLPVANSDGSMHWVKFDGQTQTGIFGFAEAAGDAVTADGIDLAIVPALAVDRAGVRLGKGKGYYDRALKLISPLPAVVAVIFDDELLDEIPVEAHDHPVDCAVTPTQTLHFTNRLK